MPLKCDRASAQQGKGSSLGILMSQVVEDDSGCHMHQEIDPIDRTIASAVLCHILPRPLECNWNGAARFLDQLPDRLWLQRSKGKHVLFVAISLKLAAD